MPTIDVRDTKLYYDIAGDGDPALLFIHGMCGGGWSWEGQMDRLSTHFTCVAYDRRGHSRSEPGTRDQSCGTHVDDAAALIEVLDLDRPIVVGSSAGGAIATELLHRYPHLVRGGVLSEPALFSVEPGAGEKLAAEFGPAIKEAVEQGGQRAAVDAFFQRVCTQFWEQADETRRDRLRDNAPMMFAALEAEGSTITTRELADINQPVLVVAGGDSFPIGRSIARTLTEHLPNARYIELEDCGHVTYAEKPVEFARAVTAFVREIAEPVAPASRS